MGERRYGRSARRAVTVEGLRFEALETFALTTSFSTVSIPTTTAELAMEQGVEMTEVAV